MTYCHRCDQCGAVTEEHDPSYHLDHRQWDDADQHYAREINLDFCGLPCLAAWVAAQPNRE